MWIRILLAALLAVGIVTSWCYLFLIFAMAANPNATKYCFIIAILILLYSIPLFVSIFMVGKTRIKKRRLIIALSFLMPVVLTPVAFRKDIRESHEDRTYRKNLQEKYATALAHRDKEPATAFLTCLEAQTLSSDRLDCNKTLDSVTDPSFCRTLCERSSGREQKSDSQYCRKGWEILKTIDCAKVMVDKMNPLAPTDVCKAAGLMNYQSPGNNDYFQGYYYDCLNSAIKVGENKQGSNIQVQYKSLAELLKIKTQGMPRHTKTPLR